MHRPPHAGGLSRGAAKPGSEKQKSRSDERLFSSEHKNDYLILVSLYMTCLRTLGSNFMISILAGVVRLFLVVV
jgi:hypothetical protein